MTTLGHQKLIVGTVFATGVSLPGKFYFSGDGNSEQPRFHSENASEGVQSTGLTKGRDDEPGATKLTEPASPQKQSSDLQRGEPGDGGQAADKGERYAVYWKRLKKITVVWMIAWTVPAIIMHVPIGVTSQVTILNGIPLHWFNAAFLAIVIGIALTFMYAYVMERTDRAFKGD